MVSGPGFRLVYCHVVTQPCWLRDSSRDVGPLGPQPACPWQSSRLPVSHQPACWPRRRACRRPAVLKTRRSMRAVHFHPHGLPIVLTAEVQDPSPTHELPATLTEQGPFVQQRGTEAAEDAPATPAATSQAGGWGSAAAAAPPSGELPIPSPQLLQGTARSSSSMPPQQQQQQQDVAQPAAGVYVATADGPVPVQQLSASVSSSASQGAQPAALDLPAAALALSTPLQHLQLRSSASSPGLAATASAATAAAAEGPSSSGRHPHGTVGSSRPGAPGWVPPNSAHLPPSMVPTGWELPFPSTLFSGGQQAAAGAAGGPGSQGQGPAEADSSWAATVASLPQVMAAFSAAAWNIIGEEQPPRVRLRMWRFDASKPTALLAVLGAEHPSSNLLLQIPDAVLCSGGRCGGTRLRLTMASRHVQNRRAAQRRRR